MIEPLDQIRDGYNVFIDANIFVYGVSGGSPQCHHLLERCAREEVTGVTNAAVLSEVLHQLMLLEAHQEGIITNPRDWRTLKRKPEFVKQLQDYWNRMSRLLDLNLLFIPLESSILQSSQPIRQSYGLLTNDSLIVATMQNFGLEFLASNDSDFEPIPLLTLYRPTDVP